MQEGDSDKELVKRFQRGEQSAFELLAERHHQRLFRMASVLLVVPDHAADVTQEVFLRAHRGLKGFRFQAEPSTWLIRTMKNVCKEFNRKERFSGEQLEQLSSQDSVEEAVIQKRTLERIRAVLEGLTERQREVVLLRVFEDMSVEDTARAMGCRPGTVKALLHKALQAIRRQLGEQMQE